MKRQKNHEGRNQRLGKSLSQSQGKMMGQALLHQPVRQMHQPAPCLSLFWASLPEAFPITSPNIPVVFQGYFFTSNTSKEGNTDTGTACQKQQPALLPRTPPSLASVRSPLYKHRPIFLSTFAPQWSKVPISQGSATAQKHEGGSSSDKSGPFSPCSHQAGWQMPAEDPNAQQG